MTKKTKKIISLVMLITLLMSIFCVPAFATGDPGQLVQEGAAQMNRKFSEIYSTLLTISGPISIVSLAYLGIKLMTASKAKVGEVATSLKYLIFAMVLLFILPHAISIGMDIGQQFRWDPRSPGA